jgi:hypothetical protein
LVNSSTKPEPVALSRELFKWVVFFEPHNALSPLKLTTNRLNISIYGYLLGDTLGNWGRLELKQILSEKINFELLTESG